MTEKPKVDAKFAKWKGVDRTEIEWNPTIDLEACVGCGMCVTSCGRSVFEYDVKNKKAVVERPYNCMVGCTSCESWCIYDAISFPEKQYVKDLIKEKKLLTIVKKELEQKYGGEKK